MTLYPGPADLATETLMIPLSIPQMTGREREYLNACIDENFVSSVGPFVDRFEYMVAEASGAKACAATSSGTTGLHAALTAVGVGPGDRVAVPSFSFIASANAIRHCGAEPWLFDIDAESWTIDVPSVVEVMLSKPGIAALMPVHTMGVPADMKPLVEAARKAGIPVVVDGAAALGATYHRKASGDLGADLTVYSFNGNKTVTAGGGGAVCGSDTDLVDRVRHLTTTARTGSDYSYDEVGFNYRMTNLQAAVGCAQMESLGDYVAAKQAIHERYATAFSDIVTVQSFPCPSDRTSACWFSGLVVDEEAHGGTSGLITALRDRGVGAGPFWKPIHLQTPYRGSRCEPMPVTESLWKNIIVLPCSTGLSEDDQETVINVCRELLKDGL